MEIFLPALIIFVALVIVFELLLWARRILANPDRGRINKRIQKIAGQYSLDKAPDIFKRRKFSDIPTLNTILLKITFIERLDRLIYQANSTVTPGFLILLSLTILFLAYFIIDFLTHNTFLAPIASILLAILPLVNLRFKKKKRMKKFERQLPEGVELIARSLRAGHAFSTGLKLASDEFDDPLGPEFGLALHQINFGMSVAEALKDLASRVECPDLNFFVVAVILQRETGGNLAEILENIARIMRERFKFNDKVRVLSAEGRMSMWLLMALPVLLFFIIRSMNPSFLTPLLTTPVGQIMLVMALVDFVIGFLVMNHMIQIKI